MCIQCLAIVYQRLVLPSLFLEFPFAFAVWLFPQLMCAILFSFFLSFFLVTGSIGQSANPRNSFLFIFVLFSWSDSCIGLPDIPHAVWNRRGYELSNQEVFAVGTALKYQCKHGYRPIPDEPLTVTCQENFTWTPSEGCERKWTLFCVHVCVYLLFHWKCWTWPNILYLIGYNWFLKMFALKYF